MIRFFSPLFLSFLLLLSVTAQVPSGYYAPAEGKTNAALKTALHQIIEKGTRLGYGSGSGKTWSGFEKTDLHPDGHVWDMYSSNKVQFPGGGGVPSGMNIEHSVAKSWWGGTNNDAYKDLYHLNPSNTQANSARGSYPLGINSGGTWSNGVIKVGKNTYGTEYTGVCFEPLDEYKGDFARAYLYMFTCYEDFSWTGTSAPTMLVAKETWPMLKTWAKNLLLEWHRKDPVSDKELKRAAEIFKIQSNRNPYIDYPELVEHLWGNRVGQPWNAQGGDFPYISAPVYGQEIDFGKVAYGNNRTTTLHVKASNLTGNLTLSLTGTNASDFTVSTQTIEKTQAESGFDVTVTYNAVSVGAKAAVLNIAGGGVTSVSVPLKALSSDEFMALPASNVSHSGFTANWTVSATAQNYLLNVFTLESDGSTQPAVLLEESFDNGMPALWDAGGFTEVKDGSVKMASGGSNGSISTPPVDLSTSGIVLTVKAKRYGTDSNADITVNIDNGEVAKWTTEGDSKEFSITLDEFSDASVITFSAFKDRRVFIESVKLEIPAVVYRPVSVAGFPVETGNILTYPVNGLLENTLYYYSVTALGNDAKESEKIAVETQSANAVDKTEKNSTLWIRTQSGVQLKNMSDNYQITVTDLLGKKVFTQSSSAPELHISLPQKGLYLLRIQHNQQSETIKVLY